MDEIVDNDPIYASVPEHAILHWRRLLKLAKDGKVAYRESQLEMAHAKIEEMKKCIDAINAGMDALVLANDEEYEP